MTALSQSYFPIRVDSGKTGSGKSTNIRRNLQLNSESDSPSILAVPSKDLQYEYMDRLCDKQISMTTINHTLLDENQSVTEKYINSLCSSKTINITHEALKLVNHKSINFELYKDRDLIIDEAFNPLWCRELTVKQVSKNKDSRDFISVDWAGWLNPTENVINGFIELKPKKQKTYSSIYDISFIRMIENPNFKIFVSESNWNSLLANDADRINIFGVFDISLLSIFKTVHIASAAFHTTLLGILMTKTGYSYKVVHEYAKQAEKFVFHVATTNGRIYSHSKHAIAKDFQRVETFRKYVDDVLGGRNCLLLRNRSDISTVAQNYIEISNNCHGINSYRHIDAISLESTYNPNTNFRSFLKNVLNFSDDEIVLGITANTFYQCIMRTAARDNENRKPIDVFILDGKVFPVMVENYFDSYDVKHVEIGDTITKRIAATTHKQHKQHKQHTKIISIEHSSISDFIEHIPSGSYPARDLYEQYIASNSSMISMDKFALSIEELGIEKKRTKRGMAYKILDR